MLDFSEKIYRQIMDFCGKRDMEAGFSGYPFFDSSRRASAAEIIPFVRKNFKFPGFPFGLYIHVPFCQSRCLFCRFYSEGINPEDSVIDEYLDALERQLEMYGIDFRQANLRNLYLGGGTPTLLGEEQLSRLFGIVRRFFNFDSKKIQVSIEATLKSITVNKVRHLRSLGVNRVSLGVESFDEKVLKRVGRNQSAADVFRAVKVLRKAGIGSISFDLIAGLPGETLETYRKTIEKTLSLKPEAIQIFRLLPTEKMKRIMEQSAVLPPDGIMNLFAEGFSRHYRICAKGITMDLVKNQQRIEKVLNANQRWLLNLRPCLGLGPASVSLFPNIKFIAGSDARSYIKHLKYGDNQKIFSVYRLDADDRRRNFVITSIALARCVDKKKYFELFKTRFERDFRREVNYLKRAGIVRETKNRFVWRLKDAGVGYKSYFPHVLKFWYHPKYIRKFINANNLKTIQK